MSPTPVNLASLMATSTYTNASCPGTGPATVSAALDNGTGTASVTVQEPPTIGACPANIQQSTDPGQCSAAVSFATPGTTKGCPIPTVTCAPASGSTFPKGATTDTCTASNVEVADTTLRYDREIKIPLYARHGIPEVWLIDVEGRTLTVFETPADGRYRNERRAEPVHMLAPKELPGVEVDLSRLFGTA